MMIRFVAALTVILASTISFANKPKPAPASTPTPAVEKIDEAEQTAVLDVNSAVAQAKEQYDDLQAKLSRLVAGVTERHKCTPQEINWKTSEIVRVVKSPIPDLKEKKLSKK